MSRQTRLLQRFQRLWWGLPWPAQVLPQDLLWGSPGILGFLHHVLIPVSTSRRHTEIQLPKALRSHIHLHHLFLRAFPGRNCAIEHRERCCKILPSSSPGHDTAPSMKHTRGQKATLLYSDPGPGDISFFFFPPAPRRLLWLHLWHIEVPRLRAELELQRRTTQQ